jgi:hypothetical protein
MQRARRPGRPRPRTVEEREVEAEVQPTSGRQCQLAEKYRLGRTRRSGAYGSLNIHTPAVAMATRDSMSTSSSRAVALGAQAHAEAGAEEPDPQSTLDRKPEQAPPQRGPVAHQRRILRQPDRLAVGHRAAETGAGPRRMRRRAWPTRPARRGAGPGRRRATRAAARRSSPRSRGRTGRGCPSRGRRPRRHRAAARGGRQGPFSRRPTRGHPEEASPPSG